MVQENSTATPPPIMWAQRSGVVFLTVCLEDCKSPIITIEPTRLYFKGIGGTERREHEVDIQLFKEIDPEKSEKFVRDRNIEIVLKKRDAEGGYWPHLTADRTKHHWLKVDFNRWRDEESSDEDDEMGGGGPGVAGGNYDLAEMMKTMGGLGAGDNKPSLDELETDSDDEDLPGLE
ncbi:cytosolic prostaglandin E synthase isoform X1 [Rhodnius prolixus]|uniref:Putative hsp90 co-chaperone p23 n=2 Tax=Rhodnius TaxID=13248 RepID=R4G851_RHOPR